MEEVQSWWQVPAVAHFCYVFRSPFNLLFFEIAELESALLNIQDPDMCISLEQLIIRLLQGYFDDEVTDQNWHERMHEFFEDACEEDNPLDKSIHFYELTPYSKIDILLKLCELRLDVKGALDEIKDIPSEDMQAKCLGKDSQNNLYWYFYDERLYKENPSVSKKNAPQKNVEKISTTKKPTSLRAKKSQTNSSFEKTWSVVCFNISDWENLLKQFSKSKNAFEKELANAIKDYIPVIQENVDEKERLLRKRFLELAPKRTSSRISQKRLQEEKVNMERQASAEKEKMKVKNVVDQKKIQAEERKRRAEERLKIIEERAERAKLHKQAKNSESSDEDDNENIKPQQKQIKSQQSNGQDNSKKSTYSSCRKSSNTSKYQVSLKDNNKNSDFEESEDETSSEISSSDSINRSYSEKLKDFVLQNKPSILSNKGKSQETNNNLRPRTTNHKRSSQNSSDTSKWNSKLDSKRQKLHILHNSFKNESSKRIKTEAKESRVKSPGAISTASKENKVYKRFNQNFITFGKVIPPAVVRLEVIKSSPKKQVKR